MKTGDWVYAKEYPEWGVASITHILGYTALDSDTTTLKLVRHPYARVIFWDTPNDELHFPTYALETV